MLFEIFTLLVLFQLKHFICDYPLQTQYMLGKANATNWVKPLAAHAFIHLSGTWIVLHLYGMLFSLDYSKYIFTIVALFILLLIILLLFILLCISLLLNFMLVRVPSPLSRFKNSLFFKLYKLTLLSPLDATAISASAIKSL